MRRTPKSTVRRKLRGNLIIAIIDDTSTPSDNAALARIDSRIDSLMNDTRRQLKQETADLLSALDARDFATVRRSLARADALRDELDEKVDAIRAEYVEGQRWRHRKNQVGADAGGPDLG